MKYKKRSLKKKQRQRYRFSKKYAQRGGGLMDAVASIEGQSNTCVAVHPTQPLVAVGDDTGNVTLWAISTSKPAPPKRLAQLTGLPRSVVKCIEFHSTLPFLAAACSERVLMWRFDQISEQQEQQQLEPSHIIFGSRDIDTTTLKEALVTEDVKFKNTEKEINYDSLEKKTTELSTQISSMKRYKDNLMMAVKNKAHIGFVTTKISDEELEGIKKNLLTLEEDIKQKEIEYQAMNARKETRNVLLENVEKLMYEVKLMEAKNEVSCIAFHPTQPYIAVGQNNTSADLTNKVAMCRFSTDSSESKVIYDVIPMMNTLRDQFDYPIYNQVKVVMVSFSRDGNIFSIVTDSDNNNIILDNFHGEIQPTKMDRNTVPMFASMIWANLNVIRMGYRHSTNPWYYRDYRKFEMFVISSPSAAQTYTCITPHTSYTSNYIEQYRKKEFISQTQLAYKWTIDHLVMQLREDTLTDEEKTKYQQLFFASAQSGLSPAEQEAIRQQAAALTLIITPESIANIMKDCVIRSPTDDLRRVQLSTLSQINVLDAMMRQQGVISVDKDIQNAYETALNFLISLTDIDILNDYEKMKLYQLIIASLQSGILDDPKYKSNLLRKADAMVPPVRTEHEFIIGCKNGSLEMVKIVVSKPKMAHIKYHVEKEKKRLNRVNGGEAVECVAVHPSLPLFASASRNTAKLWSLESREELDVFPLQPAVHPIRSVVGFNEQFLVVSGIRDSKSDAHARVVHVYSIEELQKELQSGPKIAEFVDELIKDNRQGDNCPICGDSMNDPFTQKAIESGSNKEVLERYLVCGHKFHTDCIEPWIKTGKPCPLCRAEGGLVAATPQRIIIGRQKRAEQQAEQGAHSVGKTLQDRSRRFLDFGQDTSAASQAAVPASQDVAASEPEPAEPELTPEQLRAARLKFFSNPPNGSQGQGGRRNKLKKTKKSKPRHHYSKKNKKY